MSNKVQQHLFELTSAEDQNASEALAASAAEKSLGELDYSTFATGPVRADG